MKPSRTTNEPCAAGPPSPAPRSAAPRAGQGRALLRHRASRREAAAARRYARAGCFRPGSLPQGSGDGAAKRDGARSGRSGFAAAAAAATAVAVAVAVVAAGAALGAFTLLAAMPEARAATSRYQVEVVIFGQGDEAAWEEGYWRPADGPPPVAENTVELLAGPPAPSGEAPDASRSRHAFRRLPVSTLELRQAVDRLERSDEYRVLLHAAWRQPEARGRRAPGVRLSTRRGAAADGRLARGSGETAVEGTIRLRRQRFLYVDADLAFGNLEARPAGDPTAPARAGTAPGNAAPAQGAAPRTGGEEERPRAARLTRTLRVRLGRLQYVDHPLFGVLLLVRRLP